MVFGRCSQACSGWFPRWFPSTGGRPQLTPGGMAVEAPRWGISKAQLQELLQECREDAAWDATDNVRAFVQKFVEPRTAGTGMGLALLLNHQRPREVNLMVSHSWDENAQQFFEDVVRDMFDRDVAFICFLGLYQGTGQDIADQLGPEILTSPFAQVIKKCAHGRGRMLVVPNEELRRNGQGLYSRMWCDLEIFFALQVGCFIQFAQGTTQHHLCGAEGFSSRHARCGNPASPMNADERRIRDVIETMPVETPEQRQIVVIVAGSIASLCAVATSCVTWEVGVQSTEFYRRFGWVLWVGYIGTLPAAVLGRWLIRKSFAHQDGYAELDEIIGKAAEFHLSNPGVVLNPVSWESSARRRGRVFGLNDARIWVMAFALGVILALAWPQLLPEDEGALPVKACYYWFNTSPIGLGMYGWVLNLMWRLGRRQCCTSHAPSMVLAECPIPVVYILVCNGSCWAPLHASLTIGIAMLVTVLFAVIVAVCTFPHAFVFAAGTPERESRRLWRMAGSLQSNHLASVEIADGSTPLA